MVQKKQAYQMAKGALLAYFATDEHAGLSLEQIKKRQKKYGANTIPEPAQKNYIAGR